MSWVHRFLVVPVAPAAIARHLAQTIAPPPSADGLLTRECRQAGGGSATHYVSSGLIQKQFAALLGDAAATHAAYLAAGGSTVTLEQVEDVYAAATIRADLDYPQGALDGLAALGLELIDPPLTGGAP